MYKLNGGIIPKVLKVIKLVDANLFKYQLREINFGFSARNAKELNSHPALNAIAHIDDCSSTIYNDNTAQIFVTMPYYEHGSLRHFIKNNINSGFTASFDWKIRVMLQISLGIELLHTEGYIHRDLKPENVLMDFYDIPVISDFGFVTDKKKTDSLVGTPIYIAPEILMQLEYDNKVDIFALGIIFFEVINAVGYKFNENVKKDMPKWCEKESMDIEN